MANSSKCLGFNELLLVDKFLCFSSRTGLGQRAPRDIRTSTNDNLGRKPHNCIGGAASGRAAARVPPLMTTYEKATSESPGAPADVGHAVVDLLGQVVHLLAHRGQSRRRGLAIGWCGQGQAVTRCVCCSVSEHFMISRSGPKV